MYEIRCTYKRNFIDCIANFIAEDEKVTVSYRLKKCDDAEGGGISITPAVHPFSS